MSSSCPPKSFYRAFEEKFRGPREVIKSRLQVYLPFIQPLRQYWPDAMAVDVGCGRGEWLELLAEQGFDAQGVDLDDAMLAACRELNLKVHTADALSFLRGLPDDSQAIVSGFHIAEHLPFEMLQELASQALRVLKPAGLLILETPNPENLIVSSSSFYLDPTHKRPLPPLLLSFLAEFAGFKRNAIVRLQESKDLIDTPHLSLLAVLNGASPDYAVVAQKDGPEELFAALNNAFDTEYGLTLDTLADTYQRQAEVKVQQAEVKVQQAEVKAQQAEVKAQQAEVKAQQAEAGLHAVYNSRSWRITAPLRELKRALLDNIIKSRSELAKVPGARKVYHLVKDPVGHGIRFAVRQQNLKNKLRPVIRRFPALEKWLVEKRAAQQRTDFLRFYPNTCTKPNFLHAGRFESPCLSNPSSGQRTIDEILQHIKTDLRHSNGDQ